MDLEPQEPEAASPQQDLHETANEQIGWANIFYGVIIAPITTLNVLTNPRLYKSNTRGVVGALIAVVLCGLIGSFAQCELDRELSLALTVLISLLGDLFNWLILAVMLFVIARCLKIESKFRTALIVTGWAYVPLIFKAPIVCFCYALTPIGSGQFLLTLPVLWFLILEIVAYDSLLKLGKVKTLGIAILLPPILFVTCLFWFLLWAMGGPGQ